MSGVQKPVLGAAVVALLAVAGAAYWYSTRTSGEAATDVIAAAGKTQTGVVDNTNTIKATDINVPVTGGGPAVPRELGKSNAPVTITEYSSFTCPHCAHFHDTTLPILLRDYVSAGKVKIVMADFPLNREAMDAALLSRCVADDKYVAFTTTVFANIQTWAGKHPDTIKQYAKTAGLDAKKIDACLADKATEDAIVKAMKEAGDKFGINATPSFVFNGDPKNKLDGAVTSDAFAQKIDPLVKKAAEDEQKALKKALEESKK